MVSRSVFEMTTMAPFEGMKSIARSIVSKKKRRFKQHGFDLDLSYITPRIIAMGYPSEGAEGIFRNAMSEVFSFLKMFHDNRFKVFNLCAERSYDPAKLGGNVEWIPFSDHNPAPAEIMFHFCDRASVWLVAQPDNVIAVHCKAGKGRTGVMICAYLLYSGLCSDPVSAMQYYGQKRTKNGKGVTISSQRRYLFYFNELLQNGPQHAMALVLSKLIVYSNISLKCDIQVRISCNCGNGDYKLNHILESEHAGSVTNLVREGKNTTFYFPEIRILGDVKIEVYDDFSSKKPLFYFWFNTSFVKGNVFSVTSKSELDKPSKKLDMDTQVHVFFSSSSTQDLATESYAVADDEIRTIEQLTKQLSSMIKVASVCK